MIPVTYSSGFNSIGIFWVFALSKYLYNDFLYLASSSCSFDKNQPLYWEDE